MNRIVRFPDGTVDFDPTGRSDGRGVYLCDDIQHMRWSENFSVSVEKELKVALDNDYQKEIIDRIRMNSELGNNKF